LKKNEAQKELAFNQKASQPRFQASVAAPGGLAVRRCPIAYR